MKSLIIIKAFLLSFLLFMQGCGGDDPPKGVSRFVPRGVVPTGSNLMVSFHYDLKKFETFIKNVKVEGGFNNTLEGNYYYKELKRDNCKIVLKIFTACWNTNNSWTTPDDYRNITVGKGTVSGHGWGDRTQIREKIINILERAYTKMGTIQFNNARNWIQQKYPMRGVGVTLVDVYDNDGTFYRIDRSLPLGANPISIIRRGGSGRILTHRNVTLHR